MKKTIVYAAALAIFTFSACSDNKTETAHTHEHASDTDTETATGKVVVETPSFSSVADPFKTQVSALLDEYLKVKDALVAEDAKTAQSAASEIEKLADSMPVATLQEDQKQFAEEQRDKIKESSAAMAKAADLAAQRNELEQLSEATFALTKAFGAANADLYYQHCPMAFNDKGAYWLSSEKEIRNPYYGKSMLKCGTNEEIYKQ
ncbi:DUF3347 domain-containing protein [Pontibacter beigongshangensis]|uniref:DUF3347 domain-containing protein n=1 Tax=Pontibacter beigongshangensis TaxID=2574733 RepID=UPI00164FEBB8|nr:DUF3347 domain-containing protein [Pontibacter beigongshangensis]